MADKIKVLVVDDHSIVRTGLVSLLGTKEDIKVVGDAASGDEAIEKAVRLKPNVVVMDLMMPGKDGVEATREMLTLTSAKILILTSFGSSDEIANALNAGASGAILKSCNNSELVEAIRSVARGKRTVADDIEQMLMEDPPIQKLSPRQTEILESITRGLSTQQIATQFGISPNSVKRHLRLLFDKIGASNKAEAATIAIKKHLLKM